MTRRTLWNEVSQLMIRSLETFINSNLILSLRRKIWKCLEEASEDREAGKPSYKKDLGAPF